MDQTTFPFASDHIGRSDPRVDDLVYNALYSRARLINRFLDPRRDIDHECGFPKTEELGIREFKAFYDRESVAARVVEVYPEESWRVSPEIYETEDEDSTTPFEEAFDELNLTLCGRTWNKTQQSNTLWQYLKRVDIRCGIGTYGLLLLGTDDGKELSKPAEGIDEAGNALGSSTANRKLLYMRVFDESQVSITQWQKDPTNPRYGQPIEYQINLFNPMTITGMQTTTTSTDDYKKVHWSRVIHVADNIGTSEVFGIPRMLQVYDNLHGLRKLYSGSPEMYWRGAFPGISLETHPQLGTDVDIDSSGVQEQMEQWANGLQRYFLISGVSAKSLAPQVVDPTPQIDAQIRAICIKLGVPKRIFEGSERGELASSQDDDTWKDRLSARQNKYLTPRLITPVIDRLIALQVLPTPTAYFVSWPDLSTPSAEQAIGVALKQTEAMAKYIQGNVPGLIDPLDYLTRILGREKEEALEIVKNAAGIDMEADGENPEEEGTEDDNTSGEGPNS